MLERIMDRYFERADLGNRNRRQDQAEQRDHQEQMRRVRRRVELEREDDESTEIDEPSVESEVNEMNLLLPQ